MDGMASCLPCHATKASAAVSGLHLAIAGVAAAGMLAAPVFASANLVIGYLALRTASRLLARRCRSSPMAQVAADSRACCTCGNGG